MKTLKYLTMLLLMTFAVNSCGFEEDDFLGTWESYAEYNGYEEYELYDYERVIYAFYNDGTGFYTQSGRRTQFYWDELSRGHLYLRHSDGLTEDFFYRFDRGDMLVSTDRSFRTYQVFAYIGRY
ncbi:MAG: hypothetical protein J5565_02220 [Muribaculaceae bacterium]|nr:hypothetical protein [Muribaculaceae bacterium]